VNKNFLLILNMAQGIASEKKDIIQHPEMCCAVAMGEKCNECSLKKF
jgi:hypothetical protein